MPTSRPTLKLTLGSTTFGAEGAGTGTGGGVLDAALGAIGSAIGAASSAPVVVALRTDLDLEAPGTLDVWLGSASDLSIAPGDAASLQLGYDANLTTVFTGTVDLVEPDLAGLRVRAQTDDTKLHALRVNQVYENQSAGQIVSDLASQSGLSTGTVQSALDLPVYVVDDSRSAYRHCRDLAERAGADLFVSGTGALTFAIFDKGSADRTFTYARDLLRLRLTIAPAQFEQVDVWGESPASSEGGEAVSWLVRDFSGAVGSAGSGALLRVSDPAMRTRDLAAASARGRLADVTRRATHGVAIVLGDPTVQLGGAVGFDGTPDSRLAGVFQTKRINHAFSKDGGFTTQLEFWSSGGSALGGLT